MFFSKKNQCWKKLPRRIWWWLWRGLWWWILWRRRWLWWRLLLSLTRKFLIVKKHWSFLIVIIIHSFISLSISVTLNCFCIWHRNLNHPFIESLNHYCVAFESFIHHSSCQNPFCCRFWFFLIPFNCLSWSG